VTELVARYHDVEAPHGRRHRLVVAIHPSVPSTSETREEN
jgi:hypothetical protein